MDDADAKQSIDDRRRERFAEWVVIVVVVGAILYVAGPLAETRAYGHVAIQIIWRIAAALSLALISLMVILDVPTGDSERPRFSVICTTGIFGAFVLGSMPLLFAVPEIPSPLGYGLATVSAVMFSVGYTISAEQFFFRRRKNRP